MIEFLGDLARDFKLSEYTPFLAASYVDGYMAAAPVSACPKKVELQLLATTALLIASKYEDVEFPCLKDLAYLTEGQWTERDILSAESAILERLRFDMHIETPRRFLEFLLLFLRRRTKIASDLIDRVTRVARYLSELASPVSEFAACVPSILSLAIVSVALSVQGVPNLPFLLFAELLPFPFSDNSLRACAVKMRALLERPGPAQDQLLKRHEPLPPLCDPSGEPNGEPNGKEESFCGKESAK